MREIKFRAWDKECNCYDKNHHIVIDLNGHIYNQQNGEGDSTYTIDQFTGLQDRKGRDIYEGDIVDVSMSYKGGTIPHRGVIVYSSCFGSFATKNAGGETLIQKHCTHTFEVIGNIHENPELLKAQ
jgi:uncharacterized phage protein (TIGR01671 family)